MHIRYQFSLLRHPIWVRALQGLVLSAGAPCGWLLIQALHGIPAAVSLQQNTGVYIYMLLGTAIAFTGFGIYVGYAEMKLSKLALVDRGTGVYNSNYFFERLHEAFLTARRTKKPLSLIMIDLDNFKQINQRYGHLAGDQLLKNVAKTIKDCIRSGETLARLEGDQFCVLLYGSNEEETLNAANRIRATVQQRKKGFEDGSSVTITASLGTAAVDEWTETELSLLEAANNALLRAKQAGCNRILSA
ncbi:MAG: GGDEF domain-containing protein [Exilibacterium sp.]